MMGIPLPASVRDLLSGSQAEIESLRVRLADQADETSRLKDQIRGQTDYTQSLQERLQVLAEQISLREKQIRIAQQGSFKNLGEAKWAAEDDGTVRRRFDALKGKYKLWAEAYARKNLNEAADDGRRELLLGLKEVVSFEKTLPDTLNEESIKERVPSYLLEALLADFSFKSTIMNPFFFLDNHFDEKMRGEPDDPEGLPLGTGLDRALSMVFDLVREGKCPPPL